MCNTRARAVSVVSRSVDRLSHLFFGISRFSGIASLFQPDETLASLHGYLQVYFQCEHHIKICTSKKNLQRRHVSTANKGVCRLDLHYFQKTTKPHPIEC
ncbi:probable G-protein coupled receptor 160 isoform X3 [Ambystoma mexicanum]|uniref:probable G-protein coupled receptor 160 isoform X3 n=1 Tax=Ambystoma mexicanum TaxID=8296 RepID=UPI0037E8EEF6